MDLSRRLRLKCNPKMGERQIGHRINELVGHLNTSKYRRLRQTHGVTKHQTQGHTKPGENLTFRQR